VHPDSVRTLMLTLLHCTNASRDASVTLTQSQMERDARGHVLTAAVIALSPRLSQPSRERNSMGGTPLEPP